MGAVLETHITCVETHRTASLVETVEALSEHLNQPDDVRLDIGTCSGDMQGLVADVGNALGVNLLSTARDAVVEETLRNVPVFRHLYGILQQVSRDVGEQRQIREEVTFLALMAKEIIERREQVRNAEDRRVLNTIVEMIVEALRRSNIIQQVRRSPRQALEQLQTIHWRVDSLMQVSRIVHTSEGPEAAGVVLEIEDIREVISVKALIGQGANEVHSGEWLSKDVAVKAYVHDPGDVQAMLKDVRSIARLQHLATHVNVLPVWGISHSHPILQNAVLFVTPLVPLGSLQSILYSPSDDAQCKARDMLTTDAAPATAPVLLADIFHGVAAGLYHMHSRRPAIAHLDLKLANILLKLTPDPPAAIPLLTDFDSAVELKEPAPGERRSSARVVGTMRYMAPERLEGLRQGRPGSGDAPAADIFSFGLVLFEACCHEKPFARKTDEQAGDLVIRGERPKVSEQHMAKIGFRGLSPYKSLMEECWSHRPSDRPESQELMNVLYNYLCNVRPSLARSTRELREGLARQGQLPALVEEAEVVSGRTAQKGQQTCSLPRARRPQASPRQPAVLPSTAKPQEPQKQLPQAGVRERNDPPPPPYWQRPKPQQASPRQPAVLPSTAKPQEPQKQLPQAGVRERNDPPPPPYWQRPKPQQAAPAVASAVPAPAAAMTYAVPAPAAVEHTAPAPAVTARSADRSPSSPEAAATSGGHLHTQSDSQSPWRSTIGMHTVDSEEDFNPDFLQQHAASLRKVELLVVGGRGGRKLKLAWLGSCSNLDYVNIRSGDLDHVSRLVGSVNESLRDCLQNLRELRLFDLNVTGDVGALCRSGLPALEVLEFSCCGWLGGDLDLLQKNPDERGGLEQPPPVLPRLRVLKLLRLPKLKCSIFPFGTMSFQTLEELTIWDCSELRGSVEWRLLLEAPNLKVLSVGNCPHLKLAASEGQREELKVKLEIFGWH